MRRSESGQMLMIAVMLVVFLVMSVALVLLNNQNSSNFGAAAQKRQKNASIADQGLAFATNVLMQSPVVWAAAIAGQCPAFNDASTPTGLKYFDPGQSGYSFTVSCSTGTPLPPYQVQLDVMAYSLDKGLVRPIKALRAQLSNRTLGITLPDGTSSSVALELATYASTGSFNVHWGPVSVYDPTTLWEIPYWQDHLYPRKFVVGGVGHYDPSHNAWIPGNRTLSNPPIYTDSREFWANTTLSNPPPINTTAYQSLAKKTPLDPANLPILKSDGVTQATPSNCDPAVPNCANFEVGADTAVFDGSTSPGYTLNQAGAVIYVNGNAEIVHAGIDLRGDSATFAYPAVGALIVNGNITLGHAGMDVVRTGQQLDHLRIPPTTTLEYPYYYTPASGQIPNPTTYPCVGLTDVCDSVTATIPHVSFRGFLYVAGDLYVNDPAPTPNAQPYAFNIVGAVRVDGKFVTPPAVYPNGVPLQIFYDDEINHSILVNSFELQIDSQKAVPVH